MAISLSKASVTLISLRKKKTYYNLVTLPSPGFIDFPLISFSLQITVEEAAQSLFFFCVCFCDGVCGFTNSLASTVVFGWMTERINPFLFPIITSGLCCLPRNAQMQAAIESFNET